jgi:mannosidase alpha-like ER degradation enhancer 1
MSWRSSYRCHRALLVAAAVLVVATTSVSEGGAASGGGGGGSHGAAASSEGGHRRWREPMPIDERRTHRATAKAMFEFGYDNYMRHAFPLDELNPHACSGRGVDYGDHTNININDVLGNYSVGLIDSLDSLALLGNRSEFGKAVRLVCERVSFDQNSTVQLFETTIRALGGLLSAHTIATTPAFGMRVAGYNGGLLRLAEDLGRRLLPAFENSKTGIPHPRIHLQRGLDLNGLPAELTNETCTSGATTLLLEFGALSHYTGDMKYFRVAHAALSAVWQRRSRSTGLVGSTINIQTGSWINTMAGIGERRKEATTAASAVTAFRDMLRPHDVYISLLTL